MFLKPGDQVSVADLNKGVIIQSGNDACIALADYVAGSQESFIGLMNGYAKTCPKDAETNGKEQGRCQPECQT